MNLVSLHLKIEERARKREGTNLQKQRCYKISIKTMAEMMGISLDTFW